MFRIPFFGGRVLSKREISEFQDEIKEYRTIIGSIPDMMRDGSLLGGLSTGLEGSGYYKQVWNVYACISLIARTAGRIPFLLYHGEKEIEGDPQIGLLRSRANKLQTGGDFIENIMTHLLIYGEAFAYAASTAEKAYVKPVELYPLNPRSVKVIGSEVLGEFISGYEYDVGRGPTKYRPDQVCYIKMLDPDSFTKGFSPLAPAKDIATSQAETNSWQKNLLKNGAAPSVILMVDKVNPEQREALKNDLARRHQGSANAGRPLLLEGGKDVKQMSFSPTDMQTIEAQGTYTAQIANILQNVPIELLNQKDVTYENKKEAMRFFLSYSVIPLLQKVLASFAMFFFPDDPAWRYEIDFDSIPELKKSIQELAAPLTSAYWLTPDEKREAMGYSPMGTPEMERIYIPSGMIPVDEVGAGVPDAL